MWGVEFLLILDLWGISFHGVIVFGLGKNLLFKSVLGHCVVPWLVARKCGQSRFMLYLGAIETLIFIV